MNTRTILKQKNDIILSMMDEPNNVKKLRLIEKLWDLAVKFGEHKGSLKRIS